MTELIDKLPATLRRIASGRVQMRVGHSRLVPVELLEAAADEIERLRAEIAEKADT